MNNKKTICFVVPTKDTVGGIYTWYLNIKKRTESFFNILEINTAVSNPTDNSFKFLKLINKFFRVFSQKKLLKKFIKQTKIDILHICTSGGFGSFRDYMLIKTAKKHDIKIVLHLHFGKTNENVKRGGLISKWMKFNLLNSNKIISIDEFTSSFLKMNDFKNVIYIPNPVNTYEINPYIPFERRYLLFIGYVIDTKGIRELLTAFKAFALNNNLDLLLVGPYEDKYICQLKKEGFSFNRVELKGKLPHNETMKILANAKFLVLPSHTEGMPNVILEAMSYGIPVLATDVGNVRQMCGESVPLVNAKSDKDLLAKMNAINNDATLLEQSKYLFSRVKDLFSIEKVYEQLKELWNYL